MATRRFAALGLLIYAASLHCVTQAQAQALTPFVLPWDDDAPGPTDLRATIARPAGQAGFVRVSDGHLYAGARRLKLFGVNVTAGACFPDHATADKVAARMARFGFNAVRFHFLDSTWGRPGLIDYDSGDWTRWDSNALDRLDYFIARLRAQGLYVNLNLLVGRRFGVGDGVDPSVNQLDWKAAHAVGFFHAPHRSAQQAYAARLLGHRNPYTGRTYAEDPAVALVEINNENGLLHTWLGGGLDALPDVFARDLRRQWNAWLARRYSDRTALERAWGARAEPPGAELLANGDLARGLAGWNVEQHAGADVSAAVTNGTAVLKVIQTGSEGWHVQFNQADLAIAAGRVYTLRLQASADRERVVDLSLMQAHAPWDSLGFRTPLILTRIPTNHTFVFMAAQSDTNARVSLSGLNQDGAAFRFADFSLAPGGRVGPGADESLADGTFRAPTAAEGRLMPAGGRRDWVRFLRETERDYWTGMHRFLKTDLGIRAPIAGTIVATATPHLMADLDVVDTHAYWQHPRFPGRDWDRENWVVENVSMVDAPATTPLTWLAAQRVAGKPHMVSEYNHPAPNPHAGEGPLFVAAFGALQDWDALFLYTYAHGEADIKAGRIPGFFDIGQHPAIMANVPVAALLFRRGDVAPARRLITPPLSADDEIARVAQSGGAWAVLAPDKLGLDLQFALRHRIALDLSGRSVLPDVPAPAAEDTFADGLWLADTDELAWRLPSPTQGLFEIRSPRARGFIGHADGQSLDLGEGVRVAVGATRTGWCTFMLTLLEGRTLTRAPRRALVVATGYTENSGMGWKNAAKNTVGKDWGVGPSLVEPIAATLTLPRAGSSPTLYPLDARGQRGTAVPFDAAGAAAARVRLGPPHRTLWYEIVW